MDFYHADRTAEEKARVHREWSAGRIHLICATIAFGMGEKKGERGDERTVRVDGFRYVPLLHGTRAVCCCCHARIFLMMYV